MSTNPSLQPTNDQASGGRLVAADGRTLPLRRMALSASAAGGIARVRLEQEFVNPHDDPLAVTYQLPLPADGAVSGFAFRLGERRIVGEIDRREAARERFEEALASGRSAALLERDRSSLFTQEIGNIPPGADLVAEVTVDQPLAWVGEGSWEWRFPTTVAPRYLGEPGRVEDAERVGVDVADGDLPPRLSLELAIGDALAPGASPRSPSHELRMEGAGAAARVRLAAESGGRLDRDVVVRWPVATPEVASSLATARPQEGAALADAAYGLLTIVPPASAGESEAVARDVIVLLDTSGSMGGEPLEQARRVVSAVVDSLGERDRLEMVEFSSRPHRWRSRPVRASPEARREALRWLGELTAGGATEMRDGILAALSPLRAGSQRQVVLVTDGLIGFEREVLEAILERLPPSSHLHAVGVGPSVNRSLTAPAARAGRGLEVVVGLGEDAEPVARRLVEHARAPLVVDLELSGSAVLERAPRRLPDLFAAAPALVALKLRPQGGELRLRGRTSAGPWEQRIDVAPTAHGAGRPEVVTLFGREAVEDLEMRLAAGASPDEVDPRVERIGLDFQVATRLTSWVAVSLTPSVDPTEPTRRERVPHELPRGLSVEGLGLRRSLLTTRGGPPMGWPAAHPSGVKRKVSIPRPAPSAGGTDRERRVGVFGVLRDLFTEGPGPRRAEQRVDELRAGLGRRQRGPRPLRLSGRVALDRERELVVEIEVGGAGIDWALPTEVWLTWAEGTELVAELIPERTTRPGWLEAGQVVRLSLRPPEGRPEGVPSFVALESELDQLIVHLD